MDIAFTISFSKDELVDLYHVLSLYRTHLYSNDELKVPEIDKWIQKTARLIDLTNNSFNENLDSQR